MCDAGDGSKEQLQNWKHPKFVRRGDFVKALNARVDAYFAEGGISRRDDPWVYVKGAVIMTWFFASWSALVFGDLSLPLAILAAVSLGMAGAGAGFSIMHDGGHRAYSDRPWVNRWTFRVLDFLGASSYIWNYKHNILHHTYSNIDGFDDDIDVGVLGRLSPEQPRYWGHRFQHIYVWILYGLLPAKWHFFDDFRVLWRGKIGQTDIVRPKGKDLLVLVCGKIAFASWLFVIPSFFHSVGTIVAFFLLFSIVEGLMLGVVFQLAHCVDNTEFPAPDPTDGAIGCDWAEHQMATTSDFATDNKLLNWYVGGLNFQVVHHLFPKVTHTRYPALAKILATTAEEFGVPYHRQPTLSAALRSHFRHMKVLGRPS